MEPIGSRENPVHMRWMDSDIKPGKLIFITALTIAPVAIAILMQNSALRQAIQLRAYDTGRKFCARNAKYWQTAETILDHKYEIARL